MSFLHKNKKKKSAGTKAYDPEKMQPAIRCSICTGEQVAGFLNRESGRFREDRLVRNETDIESFRADYGIDSEIVKIY